MHATRTTILCATGFFAGCYTATLDEDADGVFACQNDDECPRNQLCTAGRCVSDEGPELRVTGPEPLSKFTAGETATVRVFVVGSGIELDEPGPEHREGAGYLQISIDGEEAGGPVLSGSLEDGISRDVDIDGLEAGLHRIEVQAHRLDGTPYANSSALGTGLFWGDDGESHVGIASPWPGSRHAVDENLEVEVVALNFQFIQPDFGDGPVVDGEGHTHVYVNTDFPSCLPGCLFNYAVGGSMKPPGSDPSTRVSGALDLEGSLMMTPEAGPLTLSASLNYSEHFPVPATSTDGPEWDDDAIYDQFRVDEVEITLVE